MISIIVQCGRRTLRFVYVNYDETVGCACCKIVSTCNRVGVALGWDGDLASQGDTERFWRVPGCALRQLLFGCFR